MYQTQCTVILVSLASEPAEQMQLICYSW